jgi:hypothetical protein
MVRLFPPRHRAPPGTLLSQIHLVGVGVLVADASPNMNRFT